MRGFRLIRPPACGTRRPSGGPGRMPFRCAARVPDRSGPGAACPAVVRRLRYLRRAIICFHVPNSRIRSFHIRQPWLAVSYCVPTMKSFSSSDFMRRNRKLENRYIKYMIGLRCIVRFRHVFLQGMPERSGRSRRDSDGFSQPGQSNEPRGGADRGFARFLSGRPFRAGARQPEACFSIGRCAPVDE